MKTVTVTATQTELRKLVEEAYAGAQVVLAYGDKKVKLERYASGRTH
jgi:antitoxin (DNA-binding transcriptional repressor) of toxin-antitoxin stability system